MSRGAPARWRLAIVALLAVLASPGGAQPPAPAPATELKGRVAEVRGQAVVIALEGSLVPGAGDRVELFFRLPDGEPVVVGTWRVTAAGPGRVEASLVEASGPAQPGYDAVVFVPATRAGASPAVGKTPGPASGAGIASPPGAALAVDVGRVKTGLLGDRKGHSGWEGGAYVIQSSPDRDTVIVVSTRAADALEAAARILSLRASYRDHRMLAGLALMADRETLDWRDGDVVLLLRPDGQLWAGEFTAGRWIDIPLTQPASPRPASARDLGIRKEGGTYRFSSGAQVLGEWRSPRARPHWVFLFAHAGVHAAFESWRVDGLNLP